MSGSESAADAAAGLREPPDLRLMPVVAGLWVGIAAALLWQPPAPLPIALGAASALVGAASLWAFVRGRRRSRALEGRALVAALLGSSALLGLALGALQVQRMSPSLTERIVAASAVVRITGTVTGDPRAHPPLDPRWDSPPTWTAEVRVHQLTYRSVRYDVRLPVVVRGAAVQALQYGAQIELAGRASPPWHPESSSLTVQVLGPISARAPPGAVASVTNRVRAASRAAVAGLPADAGALLLGLAVGDESLVGPALDQAMIRSGLAHLTAVSGSNTSLVVALALGAVAALGLGWRVRVGSALLVLAAYVALVRPQPSVLRAAAMGLVALLALTAGGRRRGPPALCAAAIALLVWRPAFALSWGFGLSVVATAGLLLVAPSVVALLGRARLTARWPEPLRAALAVAIAAHLATLPLAVGMGNGASLVALPANVVVTPLVPYATVVGLASALAAPVVPPLAVALAWGAAPATVLIGWVARNGAALPWAVVSLPEGAPSVLTVGGLVVVVFGIVVRGWRPWRDRRVVSVVVASVLVLVAVVRVRDSRWPPPQWLVLACDVGQGDAVLLRAADSSVGVLVDVGPAGSDAGQCAHDAGLGEVVVVLTHFHADHVDGLAEVLRDVGVSALLTTPTPDPPTAARHVVQLARDAHVPMRTVRAGDRLILAGISVRVLWPARAMGDPNNASVVLLADVPTGGRALRVLLTGDVEPEAQAALLARGVPQVDVVKVPHHGSSHQDSRLARAAHARIALVSVGEDNDYGHPSTQTLDQYRAAGAVIGRTDTQGPLAVIVREHGPQLVAAP